jgi:hypothetical protein
MRHRPILAAPAICGAFWITPGVFEIVTSGGAAG